MTQHCMGQKASLARAIRLFPECERMVSLLATGAQQYIEQMPAALSIFDGELRYQAVSYRALAELSWLYSVEVPACEKVIGRTIYEVWPSLPSRWRDALARVLAGEELSEKEDLVTRQDGRLVWVRWSTKPWRDVHGQIGGVLLFAELITEQVEMRRALADSEARFRATFANAAVGIAHFDSDLRWVRANEALCRILGWPIKELVTKSLQDTVHPDDLEAELGYVQQMRDGKIDKFEMEKRCLRKDGGFVWTLLALSCVRKSDRSIDYFVGVIQDISARKHAEEELADSEARFRATFENAAVGISHVAPDGKFVRFNKALSRLLGWPADELITKSVQEITHPDDLAFELAEWERLRAGTSDSYSVEKRDLRKDGTIVWIRLTRSCVRKSDGSVDYFVAVVEDISARKRAEEQVHKSEARLRATFENAAVGIADFGPDGRWLRVNEALSRIMGWSPDDLLAKSFQELTHPEDLAVEQAMFEQLQVGKINNYSVEKRAVRKDGTIVWVRRTVSCVRRSDGSIDYFVSVVEDISARKRAEEQVHLLMREANHRVKNLLGLVQAVARQTAAGNPEDFVGRFSERVQALAANQDLLGRDERQGADLENLVRAQLAHFADLVGSRITAHGPKLHLNATAAQAIGLALHELATNAAKYGALSDAGRVDLDWRLDGDSFAMSWAERGGPPVQPPDHRGFGTTVVDAMARRALGGEVQLDYARSGLEWHLTCPRENALEP
jgi:PAS domain S-box-containing protein